jgi:hypothetical protein
VDEVRRVGEIGHQVDNRKLYLAVVHDVSTWSPDFTHVPTPFTAFTALDVQSHDTETLKALGAKLIAAGCREVDAWGPGSDALHDAVDLAFIGMTPEEEWDDKLVVTTSAEEPFNEALDASLFTFGLEWKAFVAITSPQYAEQVEQPLSNVLQWHRDLFGYDVYIS